MKNVKNKLVSSGFVAIGVISTILSKDATVLVFALFIGIPLFLSEENWIN